MILTSKDLPVGRQKEEAEAERLPPPLIEEKQEDDMTLVMRLPSAPKDGPSSASFYLPDGSTMQVELMNGEARLTLTDKRDREEKMELLKRAGFTMELVDDETAKKVASDPDEPIVLQHPDVGDSNLIDAKVDVEVGKKKVQVEIVRGMVSTKNLKLVVALERLGYIIQNPHALERAKEK